MSYEKQHFEDGQVLTAAHLNHIEEGIAGAETACEGAVLYTRQTLTGQQQKWARENIGAATVEDVLSALSIAEGVKF